MSIAANHILCAPLKQSQINYNCKLTSDAIQKTLKENRPQPKKRNYSNSIKSRDFAVELKKINGNISSKHGFYIHNKLIGAERGKGGGHHTSMNCTEIIFSHLILERHCWILTVQWFGCGILKFFLLDRWMDGCPTFICRIVPFSTIRISAMLL